MKPLLSIVIPTRNRQNYAYSSIKSILSINHQSLELIIIDNSDSTKLEKLIENITDKRLVYHYNNNPLSMVHNFNLSMKYVNGKYVCFIGDDDGINTETMKIVEWANENNLDAIIPSNPVTYSWPSPKNNGEMIIYPFDRKIVKEDVKKNLNLFFKSGAIYYRDYGLPKVYHGVVKKEYFDKVFDKLGYYFGGLSPDIFASIAISTFHPKNVVSIDYPMTIAGTSYESDQTHETDEAKNMQLNNAPHFKNRGPYKWSKYVPSVYSVSSIWAESGIHALEDLSRTDLIHKININTMVVEIGLESPQNEKQILDTFFNPKNKLVKHLRYHLIKNSLRFKKLLKRIISKFLRIILGNKTITINKIQSIEIAIKKMSNYINKNNLNIDEEILRKKL